MGKTTIENQVNEEVRRITEEIRTELATVNGEKDKVLAALETANHQVSALSNELAIHEDSTAANMLINNASVFTGTKWMMGQYGNDMHVDEKGNVSALVTVKNNDGKGDVVKDVTFSKVDAPKVVALNALSVAKELGTLATCYYLASFGDNCKKYGYSSIGDFGARFCGIQAGTSRQYYRIGKFYEGMWIEGETPQLKAVYPCDSRIEKDENGVVLSVDPTESCLYNVSAGNLLQVLSIIESCEGKTPIEKLATFKNKYLEPDSETGEPLIYLSMPTKMLKEDLQKKGLVDSSKGRKSSNASSDDKSSNASSDDKSSNASSDDKSSNASNSPATDDKDNAPIDVVKRAFHAMVGAFDAFSDRYGENASNLMLDICTSLEKLIENAESQDASEA